jgi:uncharacterized protein YbcV (DUF1398 family)
MNKINEIAQAITKISEKQEEWPFPKIFAALESAGVTEYTVDTSSFEIVYKGEFGILQKAWQPPLSETAPAVQVTAQANREAFERVLQTRMKHEITYTAFLRQIAEVGIACYRVEMPSRSVTYYDVHAQAIYTQIVPETI